MVITLTTPITVGNLNPSASYPNVSLTSFHVNNSSQTMHATYEIGTYYLLAVNATVNLLGPTTAGIAANTWVRAPELPPRMLSVAGSAMLPFYATLPLSIITPLWDQMQTLIYKQIQASDSSLAGTIS